MSVSMRWVRRAAAGALAATVITVLVTTQNYFALASRGRVVPWTRLFLGELPVWYTYLLLTPLIAWLAIHHPPTGRGAPLKALLHLALAVVSVFLAILVTTAIRAFIPDMLPAEIGFWGVVWRGFSGSVIAFLIVYAAIAALAAAWRYQRDVQERRVRESQLETQLARARLDVLRMQIQPHFLFNTLHAISALMGKDVPGARRMMSRLSELLRASLEQEGTHEVALEEELRFLDRYLEIQQLRFGDRLRIVRSIDPDTRTLAVPRLLLQPLVENAITHGVAHRPEGGRVEVRAERRDGRLVLRVCDDGPGFPPARSTTAASASPDASPEAGPDAGRDRGGTGLGLANTTARLRELYGEESSLRTLEAEGGGATVELTLPARPANGRGR